jgi:hypothetical protein
MADYRAAARQAAQRYGLDPNVFLRQINQESGFNPAARSPAGAIGIAQIMPATARGWGVDPTNPIAALNAAAKNMKGYVDKYGSYRNALVAYNAGPGAVGRGSLPAETTKYIDIILNGKTPPVSSATPPAASSPISAAQSAEQAFAPITLPARPVRQITAPSAPGFAAQPTTPTGARVTPSAPQARAPRLDVNAALNALAGQQTQAAASTSSDPASASSGPAPSVKAPKGVSKFEGHTVAAWIRPALVYARAHGWKGEVNSGFRTLADQTRIYNSGVRPAAKPGTSNHEGADFPRGAVDVSDPAALSKILQRSPYAKQLQWAGGKDPPHFSHPHGGSY